MTQREHWPFVTCAAVGLLLRLIQLDHAPLSTVEAAAAWTASAAAHGTAPIDTPLHTPDSGALFGIQTALFSLIGDDDFTARLGVAITSAAVALLPWLFRHSLGFVCAITLAILLAGDPLLVGYGRLGDGAAITVLATWMLVLSLIASARDEVAPTLARSALMASAPGLLLVSGPLAWDVSIPLAALYLATRSRGSRRLPFALPIAAGTALLVSTVALTAWQGLAMTSSSVTTWIRSWSASSHVSSWDLWVALARFEWLPLALAAIALGVALRSHRSSTNSRSPGFLNGATAAALALWAVWGVTVTLRSGVTPAAWFVLQPPVFLAAAWLVQRVASPLSSWSAGGPAYAALFALVLVIAQFAGGGVIIATGRDGGAFRPYAEQTERAVRSLEADLHTLRSQIPMARPPARIDVVAPVGVDPLLGWTLRQVPNVHWVLARSQARDQRFVLAVNESGPATGVLASYPIRNRAGALQRVSLSQDR